METVRVNRYHGAVHWLRHNWIPIVFIIAVVASFLISDAESKSRDRAQREQLVIGCTRSSGRTALDAAYKLKTADVRHATHGKLSQRAADAYSAYAWGEIRLLPAPPGVAGTTALIKTVKVSPPGERPYFKLSPSTQALLRAGCELAYK